NAARVAGFVASAPLAPYLVPPWRPADLQAPTYGDALAQLNKAIELQPKLGLLYHQRARLYHECGKPEQALQDCQSAIACCQTPLLTPSEKLVLADAYALRGVILLSLGKESGVETLQPLQDALEFQPDLNSVRRLAATA